MKIAAAVIQVVHECVVARGNPKIGEVLMMVTLSYERIVNVS